MLNLDPSQARARDLIIEAPFAVVTGGPGTGKTTTLRAALDELDHRGESYELAAPTGKAAKRMSEATGREARTIHRLLGWTAYGWEKTGHNPIESDLVVVDESSMLDIELAAALFEACVNSRLVLVGDANQLPSVGPGRVLADLVEGGTCPVARLEHVHRAAAESWVCTQAPRVLAGTVPSLETRHDFAFVDTEDVASAVRAVVTSPDYAGAHVLSPQRTGTAGVDALNQSLQEALNPAGPDNSEWKMSDYVIRVGDRVIQTANNYDKLVFNGEVGEVETINSKWLRVDFGDRTVEYDRENANGLRLAYALTIHKSQGSEFPWVVVVVHSSHSYMLSRQLFYTAITRAKKGVVLVGNTKGIRIATSDKEPPKRQTALIERIQEKLGATS